jgi:2-polyprenyl-3-methyl-5-hydroxy-6-metoxy-1,4-benzoquinol methylase
MTNPCNLCHSTDFDELSNIGRDGELRTVICKNCGLVFSDPFPIDTTEYYQKNYRILYKGTYNPKTKHIYRAANVAIERYRRLESYLLGKKKVLEIGSGGGEFSYLLSKKGFDVSAIEPNEGYGNYSKEQYGLNIQIGFAQNLEFDAETFDFITMSHVLEHVDNPTTMLEKLRSWLKPNGILALEVPNVEAVCQSPKSTFHTAHLFNFNVKTLSLLAEKTGYSVVQTALSKDGGNLTLIAQKKDVAKPALEITGNYEKVFATVKNHIVFKHYLSPFPYSRLLGKVFKIFDERKATAKFTDAKHVLDSCFSSND